MDIFHFITPVQTVSEINDDSKDLKNSFVPTSIHVLHLVTIYY